MQNNLTTQKSKTLRHYAAIFFAIAVVSFIFAFLANLLVGGAVFLAKIFFVFFLALFIICIGVDIYQTRRKR